MRALALAIASILVLAACSGDDAEPTTASTPEATGSTTAPVVEGFAFTEGGVADGEPIDALFTCDGEGISPALSWQDAPEGTAEFALVVEDPDAPGGTFTHGVVYAIPPAYVGLEQGVPPGPFVSGAISLRQGLNDGSDLPGYAGPCPPEGETHDYSFVLYALDEETGLDGGATVEDLRAAMEGHVLAEATLTAPYSPSYYRSSAIREAARAAPSVSTGR